MSYAFGFDPSEDDVKDALADVRSDKSSTRWALLSYKAGERLPNTIVVVSKGEGDVEELKAAMNETDIFYAYLRVEDQIDDSVTVKFVAITVMPETLKGIKKGRVTTHSGGIEELLAPAMVAVRVAKPDVLQEDDIMEKVTLVSGSGSRVMVGTAKLGYSGQTREFSKGHGSVQKDLEIIDVDGIKEAVADVRNDATDTTWAAVQMNDEYTAVSLLGSGSGKVEDTFENLTDTAVVFIIVRIEETIDDSLTIKFAFVDWIGETIPPTKKTSINTYRNQIEYLFDPFHVHIHPTHLSEVSTMILEDKVGRASMAKSNVVATRDSGSPSTYRGGTTFAGFNLKSAGGGGSTLNVDLEDEDAVRSAIAEVRSDDSDTNWMLLEYSDVAKPTLIRLAGSGSDGLDGILDIVGESTVNYGIYRTTSMFDDSKTVKFVFINWAGSSLKGTTKAKISTHKGFVTALLEPYHVDVYANEPRELTADIIKSKIEDTAGTASKVRFER